MTRAICTIGGLAACVAAGYFGGWECIGPMVLAFIGAVLLMLASEGKAARHGN